MLHSAQHFPCLKRKAADIKHLARALAEVSAAFLPSDTDVHKKIHLATTAVVHIENVLDDSPDD
eukprot:15431756-Alexandrium_andersonii.AAC.1